MAKIHPITENHLFSKVYAKGKKVSEKNVVVYALNTYRTEETRLGITTGKKIGNAVQRSRARRLIREAYRSAASRYLFRRPYLIVVVARRDIVDPKRKMGEVLLDLERAFRRLDLLKKEEEQ